MRQRRRQPAPVACPLALDGRVDGASEQDLAEALVAQARDQGLELTARTGCSLG